jgi:hypothetical protein
MQYPFKRLLISILLLVILLGVTGIMAQNGDGAMLRFVHAIPGASAIDIYTDGQLTISGLDFGAASTYINVAAGPHQLTVTQTGATTPLWQQDVSPAAGSALTLVAASADPLTFSVFQDDLSPLRLGQARLSAIHAIDGGQAVDLVLTDGQTVLPALAFNQPAGTIDVPAFVYDLVAVPTGETVDNALTEPSPTALNSGATYTLVLYGTASSPNALWLSAPTTTDVDSGFVRLAHGVAGADAVDVFVNDTLIAPSLGFGSSATEYIPLPAGDYSVALHAAGSDEVISTSDVAVESGSWVTAVALGSGDDISLSLFDDALSTINESESVFRVINGIDGEANVALELADGTVLVDNVASGEVGDAIVEPSTEGVTALVTLGDTTSEFDLLEGGVYGGVYYNALALDGDEPQVVLFAPVSLAQGIGSAPGSTSVASADTSQDSSEVVPAPTATPAEVVQAATATLAEVAPPPTEVPQVVPAVETQPPPATLTGPTGRIVLDPGANLQLREYPSSQARSLGLAPSGAVLIILGRAGEEVLLEGITPDPSATAFIDPATLVPEDADLLPEETWLFITYNTPDGGAIDAWVNSLYLDVRDEDGRPQRLADLPAVPSNQPGEARATDVTPPPIPQDRVVARVFNLDPGVNLNIRRTSETAGEVLERVSNGTLMEFLGINEVGDWVFVRYPLPSGGEVTGWVNATYVEYLFNDQPVTLEEINEREMLVITPDDERGEVRGDVGGVVLPTVDPLRDAIVAEVTIDEGANLHLRLTADSNGESLALIPSGTLLLVTGRTGESEWLQVSFEGREGWISSAFVRLTFNGAPFELANVPALTTAVPTTPTTAPAATVEPPTATPTT